MYSSYACLYISQAMGLPVGGYIIREYPYIFIVFNIKHGAFYAKDKVWNIPSASK
jgi:hypothetical protein